ncbi:hypothetical protein DL96DRAFT_1579742 [Flagelloscypha sp. PMI_526]|nr:hypothetical protein DL96DRAFT_1579742 [Flagelloscypha sp. PMI_526]
METCTTVHDLPPEILQRVFHFFVEHWHANLWDTSNSRYDWKLWHFWETTLLHICKTWTALAKATPDLWSHIHFPLAPDELDRRVTLSSGVNLKVFGSSWLNNINKVTFYEFPERLKRVCSRIESLEFRGEVSPLIPIILEWQLAPPGAASLTCLVLHTGYASTASDQSNEDALVKLLQWSCPRLLKLELSYSYPIFLVALPTTLRILTLRCNAGLPIRSPGMSFLTSLCNLRILELSGAFVWSNPHFYEGEFHPPSPIELPSLETLSLEDATQTPILTTLAVLDTPPLLKLNIQCTMGDPGNDYSELYNTLSWMCQSVEGVVGDHLQVFCGGVDYAHIVLDWKRSWSDNNDPVIIHLDFEKREFISPEPDEMAASYADVMDFVLQLCRSVSSETLQSVDMKFTGAYMLTTDDWTYAFGDPSLTGLEELKVHKATWSDSLLEALSGTKDSEDGTEDLFMPSLQRLQLVKVVFERIDEEVDTNGLCAMLLRRRELGAGIEKLTLTRCKGLTEGDSGHAKLKELVGELVITL